MNQLKNRKKLYKVIHFHQQHSKQNTCLDDPQDLENIQWTDETGLKILDSERPVTSDRDFQIKKNRLTVKHDGGSVPEWDCFAVSQSGWFAVIDRSIIAAL